MSIKLGEQPEKPAETSEQPANNSHARTAVNDSNPLHLNGATESSREPGNSTRGDTDPFKYAPPEGHAKTVSAVLGEIVWLMSQSPLHKQFFISDLEWFVMPPILLQQFRLFYAQNKPIGVVLWAFADDEVAKRLSEGTTKLRPQDWKSGEELWVVEVIAPFGEAEEMVKDLKAHVHPQRPLRYVSLGPDGKNAVTLLA